jgi:glucosamine-phosphate N-acetyltransferase
MESNIFLRELTFSDYEEYLKLMLEFTNYSYDITREQFKLTLDKMNINNINKIIVLLNNNIIIGAGTIFRIEKLHNNPIGQIEDVIISEKYRGKGYGNMIINKLVDIGLNNMKCYKIILNCLEHNIIFYEKCGFQKVGVEMKYIC